MAELTSRERFLTGVFAKAGPTAVQRAREGLAKLDLVGENAVLPTPGEPVPKCLRSKPAVTLAGDALANKANEAQQQGHYCANILAQLAALHAFHAKHGKLQPKDAAILARVEASLKASIGHGMVKTANITRAMAYFLMGHHPESTDAEARNAIINSLDHLTGLVCEALEPTGDAHYGSSITDWAWTPLLEEHEKEVHRQIESFIDDNGFPLQTRFSTSGSMLIGRCIDFSRLKVPDYSELE